VQKKAIIAERKLKKGRRLLNPDLPLAQVSNERSGIKSTLSFIYQ
jgi:hypothetical protein